MHDIEEDEGNTCHHGTRTNEIECEDCAMENEIPNICEHEVDRDNEDCPLCDEWEERQDALAATEDDEDSDMEHGIEMDRLAEKHRERQDFAHFHD